MSELSFSDKQLPEIRVSYDYLQVSSAIEYIVTKNPCNFTEQRVEESIYGTMYRILKLVKERLENDPSYCGRPAISTMGYTVQFNWETEDWATLEVLVDPLFRERL